MVGKSIRPGRTGLRIRPILRSDQMAYLHDDALISLLDIFAH